MRKRSRRVPFFTLLALVLSGAGTYAVYETQYVQTAPIVEAPAMNEAPRTPETAITVATFRPSAATPPAPKPTPVVAVVPTVLPRAIPTPSATPSAAPKIEAAPTKSSAPPSGTVELGY